MRVNDINLCGAVQRVRLYYSTFCLCLVWI
jgi:hypothetical protein